MPLVRESRRNLCVESAERHSMLVLHEESNGFRDLSASSLSSSRRGRRSQ
jgi:hypothetical protein